MIPPNRSTPGRPGAGYAAADRSPQGSSATETPWPDRASPGSGPSPEKATQPGTFEDAQGGPRVILEDEPLFRDRLSGDRLGPDRLDLNWEQAVVAVEPPSAGRWSGLGLVSGGIALLVGGFALIDAVNFVMAQLNQGWIAGGTAALVAAAGFGLIFWGAGRELRSLAALRAVDRCRLAILAGDTETARSEAMAWAARVPAAAPIRTELRTAPDSATIRALLEAGPLRQLDTQAIALGRTAAIQAFAATAISPSPAWDALVFGWRAVRLVRQVAELHGMRPGIAATVALLRRSAFSAVTVAATNVLADAATRALVSNPLVEKLAGEAATGALIDRCHRYVDRVMLPAR